MSLGRRKWAVVMFTDVGSHSSFQGDAARTQYIIGKQRELLRPIFATHQGREIRVPSDATKGTGLKGWLAGPAKLRTERSYAPECLVEFSSALEAVSCAMETQQAVHEYNCRAPVGKEIRLRIGLHIGEVEERGGEALGEGVSTASRIAQLAGGGEICVSSDVWDQVKNKISQRPVRLEPSLVDDELAGVSVYRLEWQSDKASQRQSEKYDPRRLAVLPLTNISPDPADEYLADGMTEELIAKLSEIEGLRVIARTSVMNYKGKEKKISEIGRELEVGSIIEGSVRKAGRRVRITVQLIDAGSEEHLWASNYDRELDDIFAIQSDVASKVAASLSTGVFTKVQRKDTDDIEAYAMYIRAVQLQHENTESSLREAVALLDRALSREPGFVRACAALSRTWGLLAGREYEDYLVAAGKAEAAARKALELGPTWAEAHDAMAFVYLLLDKHEDSISEAEKAIKINPNLSDAYVSIGTEHLNLGSLQRALEAYRKAYELDPLSTIAWEFLALVSFWSGKEGEAFEILEKAKELNPKNSRVYVILAICYIESQKYFQAQEMLNFASEISPPDPSYRIFQGVLFALNGRRKEAKEMLHDLMNDKIESVQLDGRLHIQAALGKLDEAFEALMRQAETHSWTPWIKYWAIFEGLRKDRRFAEFCKKVGIPP